ncbi:protein sex-lethal-like [Bacillus rossius redtenbacheri]|uniref:protein sex-lethal-like n=1 Tax=Bacillus rossius redtenbacheri TaxID=93214 RepID=UPI002FDD9934
MNSRRHITLTMDQPDDRTTNLIVNYLPQSMTEKELFNMFVTIGPVESCRVMKDFKTGYSFGFGFVNFTKAEDAARAIKTLNGLEIQNKRLKVSYARPSGDEIKGTNVYITNLPRNINENYLDGLFGSFGNIVQRNLLKDKVTGMPRGVAFVRYNLRQEAQDAINALNGTIPENGKEPLVVKIAEEHGKQKAAYYAGWQAGLSQSRGGSSSSSRGRGSALLVLQGTGSNFSRGGYSGSRGYSNGSVYSGVMRADKSHNRYHPIGLGGGYNMYNWN